MVLRKFPQSQSEWSTKRRPPLGMVFSFPDHCSSFSKDFEDWCFFWDSHSSLFNTYFAFVLLFDIVTCHDQQKLHLNSDSHATFPKFCFSRRRANYFPLCTGHLPKKTKKMCVFFSWNVTAIFEKLSCKKQRNAAPSACCILCHEKRFSAMIGLEALRIMYVSCC